MPDRLIHALCQTVNKDGEITSQSVYYSMQECEQFFNGHQIRFYGKSSPVKMYNTNETKVIIYQATKE